MGAGDRVKQFGRTDQPRPLVDRAGIVDPDPSPGTVIGKVCGRLPLPLALGWGWRWADRVGLSVGVSTLMGPHIYMRTYLRPCGYLERLPTR